MSGIAQLAHDLARQAEAVCRHYLPAGTRCGNRWHCGNVHGDAGRSLYVRLEGERAGWWEDAATGQRGDLLNLIALNRGLFLREACDEARAFLGLPAVARPKPLFAPKPAGKDRAVVEGNAGSPGDVDDRTSAARRLFEATVPIKGTLAQAWLEARGLDLSGTARSEAASALRFHPRCDPGCPQARETHPAMIAAVTGPEGILGGVHRTFLACTHDGHAGKAPVEYPRRALGLISGNAVRFGVPFDVLCVAEGIETALSLKVVMPAMPVAAALSATHLAAIGLPEQVRRVYVAHDNDRAGRMGLERLRARLRGTGVDIRALEPVGSDFNDDLVRFGSGELCKLIALQLKLEDLGRFMPD